MNPIEEVTGRIKKLREDLKDKTCENTICYQHKKILLHTLEMMSSLIDIKAENAFEIIRDGYKGFHHALLKAQQMGERMEEGLDRRRRVMNDFCIEDIYQQVKKEFNEKK